MNRHAIQKVIETVGSQAELARLLNISRPTVNQWVTGLRPVPARRCYAIESASKGAVTRRDLRPHDWQELWPELATENDSAAKS
ncbi:MAG: transcriptional regulator [Shewanella sp.]